jgi:hypothetical protein
MHHSANEKPGIVFCHGLWADGSCFSKVIPTLQADEVIAANTASTHRAAAMVTASGGMPRHFRRPPYGGSVITGWQRTTTVWRPGLLALRRR